MTQRNPALLAQFYQLVHRKTDPDEILDIAKGIFGSLNGYEDDIVAFAENSGMPIEQGLIELKEQTTAIKKQRETERQQLQATENVKRAIEASEKYQENLDNGVSPKDAHMKTLAGEIEKAASTLETPEEKDRFISFEQYYNECITYAPWKDYRPALFNKVPFPSGTLSLIGARTSRGKTASMLNLARELITTPKNTIDQSLKIDSVRHILFITLEMSPKQLLTRLALAIAWGTSLNNPQHTKLLNRRVTLTGGPLADYYTCIKGEPLQGHSKEETNIIRKYFIDIAIKQYIEPAMKNGQLIIYDARGEKTLDTIIGTIKTRVIAGDIVLLDYIQRLPSLKEDIESYSAAATYMRLKKISDMVFNTAVISGAIIIAGAQFNRAGVNGGGNSNNQKTKGDSFSDISFRESGDLEQDAHNAIGIGWTADKQTRFYEVIKARDSGGVGDSYELDWVGAYQYMANTDRLYIASESEETALSIKRKQRDWNNVV